jgi:ABC-2 type transport system ATP-binding protein
MTAVELRHASRWYGNVVAVNDITTTLTAGITGVLGPNGAGKTTVLHMIAGLLGPSSGEVLIDGTPAAGHPGIYRTLALVPERESVHSFLTGYEFVRMGAELQQLPNIDDAVRTAIATVDMESAQHRRVGTYSKGMRQRIKVAGAIVHDPNGMDPRQRMHMMQVLRARAASGCVIVISSHILEELNDLATNVLVMVSGRLAASGHFREIRKLMTDRPHTFTVRSSDDRALASALLTDPSVFGIELADGLMTVRTSDRGTLTRHLTIKARDARITLHEIRPTDESLESVFAYLVDR